MAATSSSSPSSIEHQSAALQYINILKEVRSHEIAIAELNNMSSSRAVYLRNGNIFFRTTMQKAAASEQKQLEIAQTNLKRLSADHS